MTLSTCYFFQEYHDKLYESLNIPIQCLLLVFSQRNTQLSYIRIAHILECRHLHYQDFKDMNEVYLSSVHCDSF